MIVVDTSALVAILSQEEESELFSVIIQFSGGALVSAASAVELLAQFSSVKRNYEEAKMFLAEDCFVIEPVDKEQALIAGEAYQKYGKGNHPARLNFGDVFVYALAKQRNLPLLFKGDDFSQTDIELASGYFHHGIPR